MSSSSSSARPRASSGLFLFLEGRAGGLLADLALAAFARLPRSRRSARRSGPSTASPRDRGSRAAASAFVEGVRPFDDRVEGDRAFAQAPDHRVAAGLDALGDGDLALAAEQFDRAHLAQVHADRVVGAVDGFLLGRGGRARAAVVERIDLLLGLGLFSSSSSSSELVVLDDVDAHLADRGHDVLDLLGRHLVLRKRLVELVIGDDAALLGAGDQLLDRRVVEVDQRRIAARPCFGFGGFVFRHVCLRRLVAAGERRQPFLDLLPRRDAAAAAPRTPRSSPAFNRSVASASAASISPSADQRLDRRARDRARARSGSLSLRVKEKPIAAGAARAFQVGRRSAVANMVASAVAIKRGAGQRRHRPAGRAAWRCARRRWGARRAARHGRRSASGKLAKPRIRARAVARVDAAGADRARDVARRAGRRGTKRPPCCFHAGAGSERRRWPAAGGRSASKRPSHSSR